MASQDKIGKYTMVRHIATGGMAEIWLAEQEGPGGFSKQLVIKRILPHLARDERFSQMFLDEARTVAQLTHPNIGQVFDLGKEGDDYFLAMEFIEGIDASVLVELAAEQGVTVPIAIAVRIVADALRALDYAHTFTDRDGAPLGLVHRDVTPHNILVSNDGVVKLVDFGVAKAKENQSKTQTGAVKGKYAYMAPEQIESSNVDGRVDVFAAGVVLSELLTGEKPFGDDLAAVNAILTRPPIDPRTRRPDVPAELVEILQIAMEKDAARRYRTADMMARDLDEYARVFGHHCTNRELADFVRGLQGMQPIDTGKHQATGPRARLTEREVTPFASMPGVDPMSPTQDMPSVTPPTLAEKSVEMPQASDPPPAKGNAGLIAMFVVLILSIAGAGAGAIYMSIEPASSKKKKKPAVKEDTPDPASALAAKANPKALAHPDGTLVIVHVGKGVGIYYGGILVGVGGLTTNLRPGSYDVVLKKDGKEASRKLEVKEGLNNIDLEGP